MQEILAVGITGDDCKARKQHIKRLAETEGMNISKFILWLIQKHEERQARKRASR